MLYTKSIIKQKSLEDGCRISVMSRHTLNDGITIDSRILPDSFDEWCKILGPQDKLIGDYYKNGLSWESLESKYLEYIRKPQIAKFVRVLAQRSLNQDITILCIEDMENKCHRRLLAEECQKYEQLLMVEHR